MMRWTHEACRPLFNYTDFEARINERHRIHDIWQVVNETLVF